MASVNNIQGLLNNKKSGVSTPDNQTTVVDDAGSIRVLSKQLVFTPSGLMALARELKEGDSVIFSRSGAKVRMNVG